MTLLFSLLISACASDPNAPPELRYDLDACAECSMLVSEPAYSAALVTEDGQTLPFDDAGCLFRYVLKTSPKVRGMWFFDAAGDRWLRQSEVAFTTGHASPMGSGLKAVPVGTPGAIGVGEASGLAFGEKRP